MDTHTTIGKSKIKMSTEKLGKEFGLGFSLQQRRPSLGRENLRPLQTESRLWEGKTFHEKVLKETVRNPLTGGALET